MCVHDMVEVVPVLLQLPSLSQANPPLGCWSCHSLSICLRKNKRKYYNGSISLLLPAASSVANLKANENIISLLSIYPVRNSEFLQTDIYHFHEGFPNALVT